MKFVVAITIISILFSGIFARLDTSWWKNTAIYDIVVTAFKDYDEDGVGDIEGIISKLDYIKELGVSAIKLSPIFASVEEPSVNYPIEDFENTHLGVGSLEDFDNLMKEANARGMQIILDLPINDCSLEHEWFKKSQNRIEPYTDYFIWTDGSESWIYGSDVWEWDETRKQYYYHHFDKTTADLNLKNEAVKKEIKNLIEVWLKKGVSGFNLLSVGSYMEDEKIKEQPSPPPTMTTDLSESYEFVHELRAYVDRYNEQNGGLERVLILENKNIENYPNLRGNESYPMAHIVYNKFFGKNKHLTFRYFTSTEINNTIMALVGELKNGPAMTVLEDSTSVRTANRFQDRQYLDIWNTVLFMLPGIVHIYYGQELGVSSWKFAYEQKVTAMHWDESINAGFTKSETLFYSPNVDYWKVNVKNLINAEYSTLKTTQNLLKLRKNNAVQYGDVKTYKISDYVLAFSRSYRDQEKLIVVMNLSNEMYEFDLKQDIPENTPNKALVVTSTPNSIPRIGDLVDKKSKISLRPVSAITLSFNK